MRNNNIRGVPWFALRFDGWPETLACHSIGSRFSLLYSYSLVLTGQSTSLSANGVKSSAKTYQYIRQQ